MLPKRQAAGCGTISVLSLLGMHRAQRQDPSRVRGQKALKRSLDGTAHSRRPALLHLYTLILPLSAVSTRAAASHAAACAAGPAGRVADSLRKQSLRALLCGDGMLLGQYMMIGLHQEGCTASLSGQCQSFSGHSCYCNDCSIWQHLALLLIFSVVLAYAMLACRSRAFLPSGLSSVNYFMRTESRPRQEAQRIILLVHAGPAAFVHGTTACVLTHAVTGALLPVQLGAFFQSSMAAAARGLLAAALPPDASIRARGCSSW